MGSTGVAPLTTLLAVDTFGGLADLEVSRLARDEGLILAASRSLPSPCLVAGRLGTDTFRGGLTGALPAVFDLELCVGLIMRARNPSSTAGTVLVPGFSCTVLLGGGPMLGRGRLLLDDVRRSVDEVEPLALLDERAEDRTFWGPVPVGDFSPLVLEPEAAVCAVSDDGSLMGLVGDFGFGFTKPMPETDEGDSWIGAGFRALAEGVDF